MPTYSAFLDLVGVRDLAKNDPRSVLGRLDEFKEALGQTSEILQPGDDIVFVFSDSAFVESTSPERLAQFLIALRTSLLLNGIFFKAAVAEGRLEAFDVSTWSLVGAKTRARRSEVVRGYYFGDKAAHLFSAQERLKGVGINVEARLPGKLLVDSCYLPNPSQSVAHSFKDLRFPPELLTDAAISKVCDIVEELRQKPSSDATANVKLRRYYLSAFVSMAQSVDVTNFDPAGIFNKEQDAILDLWKNHAFVMKMWNGELSSLFGKTKGFENVHFAFFSNVYAQSKRMRDVRAVERLLCRLASNTKMFDLAKNVPRQILSDADRQAYREFAKQCKPGDRTR